MLKAAVILVLVAGAVLGGLLMLRSSARTGMPDQQTLERARARTRQDATDRDHTEE
ncbi:MAG: DUF2897 family protein [Steroidobacteraceae bacterium]|jgi:hypothetical protein